MYQFNYGQRRIHSLFSVDSLDKTPARRDSDFRLFRMTVKVILLSLGAVVLFSLLVKKDYRSNAISLMSDKDFDDLMAQSFQEPSWLLPVKQADGSFRVQNLTLPQILAYLERISDCQKMSTIHRVLYSNDLREDGAQGMLKYLNSGWTKTVYSFQTGDSKPVAVKTLNPNGEDVHNCLDSFRQKMLGVLGPNNGAWKGSMPPTKLGDVFKMEGSEDQMTASSSSRETRILEMCRNKAKLKLMKEAYLMSILKNENIVKLHDICLLWENNGGGKPNSKDGSNEVIPSAGKSGGDDVMTLSSMGGLRVTYSTQFGNEADLISLLQLSWEDRLRVCYGISKLLRYFSSLHAPLDGSVSINDFRRQQFVLVDGEVMMTDLDDLTFEERLCQINRDCLLEDDKPRISALSCSNGKCHRWHDAKNTRNAGIHFVSVLLPHGAPDFLKPLATEIINNFTSATCRTEENHGLVERLVKDFSSGIYLARVRERRGEDKIGHYEVMEGHDQPGQHDYRCRYTRGAYGCTVSVHDEEEAKTLCDMDDLCRGFVMSPLKSWTGRRYVHLKSNVTHGALRRAPRGYALYYKPEL